MTRRIEPEKRVFLQSTPAVVLEGIRAITNGLVLRRSLGDLKREIEPARDEPLSLDIDSADRRGTAESPRRCTSRRRSRRF